jgi:glycosyltransferase involved in cell wall biosynthesis
MRLLFLADAAPIPTTTGARERDLQLARALARAAEVEMVTLGPVPRIEGERFRLVSAGPPPSRVRALVTSLRAPYQVTRHTSGALRRVAAAGHWDAVHASHLFTAPTAALAGTPIVIDAHNVEAEVARASITMEQNPLHRTRLRWEAAKTDRLERRVIPQAGAVIATSDGDAEALRALGAQRVVVIPNGVDCAHVAHQELATGAGAIFVGSYDYLPNAAAARELVDEVMPTLRTLVPEASLTLVGRQPPASLTKHQPRWLHVTGEVPEVDPVLASARLTILPIRGGGGTRLKVLRALAGGVPVVSTPFGVAGLGLVPGKHFLLAESASGLAEQAARVIRDNELARTLSEAGRREVESRFDWRAVTAPLAGVYRDLVDES